MTEEQFETARDRMNRVATRAREHRRAMDALERIADGWERDAAAGRPPVLDEREAPAGDGFVFAAAAERAEQARREHVQRRARAAREVGISERLAAASRRAWPA